MKIFNKKDTHKGGQLEQFLSCTLDNPKEVKGGAETIIIGDLSST